MGPLLLLLLPALALGRARDLVLSVLSERRIDECKDLVAWFSLRFSRVQWTVHCVCAVCVRVCVCTVVMH